MAGFVISNKNTYINTENVLQNEETPIQKFFKDCSVFVTGGTGFMGKVLIEKLLRSTQVARIYILVRGKKDKSDQERFEEIFEDELFKTLKAEDVEFKKRVIGLPGDCSETGLGLSIADREILASNVDIIFHLAATVNFDENLKLALAINVQGTKDVLELAREVKELKSIVHVSTAYANCHLSRIEEKFYDFPIEYNDLETMLEDMKPLEVQDITPKILGKWPNTYTFTKAMAENLVKNNSNGLPIAVYRPAILVSTYFEPIRGWINNMYGPNGVCAVVICGLLRIIYCNKNIHANVVPVDTCIAGIIAAAWDVYERKCDRTPENIPIYNNVSSQDNPITWGEFRALNYEYAMQYPQSSIMWTLTFDFTSNKAIYVVKNIFYHYIPAIIFDTFAIITWQKPRLLKTYKKIQKFVDILSYFSTKQFTYTTNNMNSLWKKMDERDKEIFPFDIRTVMWLKYFSFYAKGIREYLLKDPPHTIPAAKKRLFVLTTVHNVLKASFYYIILNIVLLVFSQVFAMFFDKSK